jgi:hypothetical protein
MAMNPMGGIDQQITQRSSQFKNDPNALMQQYGQSKDILDLIAAQRAAEKVQKEKQLAALQMQGNPPTVADQLEQELIASEKEQMTPALSGMKNLRDRTKGVAGVLAQKQQEQQKRMQQMGQQPQRPPQQRPQGQPQGRPMMAGGGLLSQRAPNLERMYGGGIVGFEAGVYIPTEEEIDAAIRKLGLRSASRESVRNMLISEQKLKQQRETVGSFFEGIGQRAKKQRATSTEAMGEEPVRGLLSDTEEVKPAPVEEVVDETAIDIAPPAVPTAPTTPRAPKTGTFPALEQKQQGQGLSGLPGANLAPALLGAMGVQNAEPDAEQKPIQREEAAEKVFDVANLRGATDTATNALSAGITGLDTRAIERTPEEISKRLHGADREELLERLRKAGAKEQEVYAAQEKQNAKERMIAGLIGAGGSTSGSGALVGYGKGRAEAKAAQDKLAREMAGKSSKSQTDLIERELKMAADVFGVESAEYKERAAMLYNLAGRVGQFSATAQSGETQERAQDIQFITAQKLSAAKAKELEQKTGYDKAMLDLKEAEIAVKKGDVSRLATAITAYEQAMFKYVGQLNMLETDPKVKQNNIRQANEAIKARKRTIEQMAEQQGSAIDFGDVSLPGMTGVSATVQEGLDITGPN